MNKLNLFLLIILFSFITNTFTFGRELDIRIFAENKIESFLMSPIAGKYNIYENEKLILEIVLKDSLNISIDNSTLKLSLNNKYIGNYKNLSLKGVGFTKNMMIKLTSPLFHERTYDDDFIISARDKEILLINHIDIERYIAGVVKAESAHLSDNIEYYKVQSIISRTYAIKHMEKHIEEGYHLCDRVHCQVFKGRCYDNLILRSTYKTYGDVIVDHNNDVISAAFHSNSGGYTVNSEDVWMSSRSYLRGVTDSFSIALKNYQWELTMSKERWLNYLAQNHDYDIKNKESIKNAINFKQNLRLINFHNNIPLKTIRLDLKLRSTYFSITPKDKDYIIIKGKGYGHAVGLSQEGAMNMVKKGFTCDEIINFYYQEVKVVNFEEIIKNK